MKTCEVISGFYVDGVPTYPGESVDLPDDLADTYYTQGLVDIVRHNGVEVAYAACCCSAHDDDVVPSPCHYEASLPAAS